MNRQRPLPRSILIAVVLAGTTLCGSAVLFALANSQWVVVNLPAPLLDTSVTSPAFEARLWAIMLTCFGLGLSAAAAFILLTLRRARALSRQNATLDSELAQLRRLLASLHHRG